MTRARVARILAFVLLAVLLPWQASADDVVVETRHLFSEPEYDCGRYTKFGYTVDVAKFTTLWRGCSWMPQVGDREMRVTVTMSRYEWGHEEPSATVTAVHICKFNASCDLPIEMPHPNPETAGYGLNWIFLPNYDGEPWFVILKREGIGCGSRNYANTVKYAQCSDYWAIRTPDSLTP